MTNRLFTIRFLLDYIFKNSLKRGQGKVFGPDLLQTFVTLTPGCPGLKKFFPTARDARKHALWCRRQ